MATMERTRALVRDPAGRGGLRAGLSTLWRGFLRRRAERRALAAFARLDPRLMRDVGVDPERVREAAGGWDAALLSRRTR